MIIMKQQFSHRSSHKMKFKRLCFVKMYLFLFFLYFVLSYTWKATVFIKEELKPDLENS